MKIQELITTTNEKINDNRNVVYILIEHLSNFKGQDIFDNLDKEINFDINVFNKAVEEYMGGKPIQHIVGYEWFMGRKIKCSNGAFVPRYETEQLCEQVIYACDDFFEDQELVKADIGTGSGAIALTLDLELNGKTYATEISEDASKVANQNFKDQGAKVDLVVGNMLDPLIEKGIKLDLLVSNPPYIKNDAPDLDASVKKYDPAAALWGGEDGLDFYREILDNCHKVIKEKAIIAFEFGWDQKEELEKIVSSKFKKYEFMKDYDDKWRILIIWVD